VSFNLKQKWFTRGLAADEQVINLVSIKVLEKVCDHVRFSDLANATASSNCGATAHLESSAATRPLYRTKWLLSVARPQNFWLSRKQII